VRTSRRGRSSPGVSWTARLAMRPR
jgi:hypothetical protein